MHSRYERKFVVRNLTKKEVETVIKLHPYIFDELFYEREINNIYFDTFEADNFKDHSNGINQREKIRIRWYGNLKGIAKNPLIEIKRKTNDTTVKEKYEIKEFVFSGKLDFQSLRQSILNCDIPLSLKEKLKILNPTLVNRYWRKYFLSKDKKFRITIDWDMDYYRINHHNGISSNRLRDYNKVIVELKYSFKDDDLVYLISSEMPFRLDKSSKYVSGIHFLHYLD